MSWEMAWLNYKGKKIYKEIKFLRNIYTDLSGEIINNSINELKKVSKDILNLDLQVSKEKSLEAEIILRKVFNDTLGEEGFCIARLEPNSEGRFTWSPPGASNLPIRLFWLPSDYEAPYLHD